MIEDFQTLLGKKNITKDNVTSIKVRNDQFAALQSMIAPQPFVLQKWVCLFGHLCMEARSNVDNVAHRIRKSHDEDVKNKVEFCKGTED